MARSWACVTRRVLQLDGRRREHTMDNYTNPVVAIGRTSESLVVICETGVWPR